MGGSLAWAAVGGGLAILAGIWFARRIRRRPGKRADRKPGVVYLFQFARPVSTLGPNLSPFCLKLETYLRMANVPYESVRAQSGPKGKLPYIELDGQEVADSGFCVRVVQERFNVKLDEDLSDEQRALGHAVMRMLEESTYWTLVHRRWIECSADLPFQFLACPPWYVFVMVDFFKYRVRQQLHAQGTGRHTPEEIAQIAEYDLRALSDLLAHKQFMLGSKPSSVDAAVFGLLAVFMWSLPGSVQETLIKNELVNLQVYCWRMRRLYWPDWDELRKSPSRRD